MMVNVQESLVIITINMIASEEIPPGHSHMSGALRTRPPPAPASTDKIMISSNTDLHN